MFNTVTTLTKRLTGRHALTALQLIYGICKQLQLKPNSTHNNEYMFVYHRTVSHRLNKNVYRPHSGQLQAFTHTTITMDEAVVKAEAIRPLTSSARVIIT